MPVSIIVGAQWGDEGKGKIVDLLTKEFSHVVRSQGGNNAGHTIQVGERVEKLHLLPSGILHPNVKCYIADGVVLDPEVLLGEIEALGVTDNLFVSPGAHVITREQRERDQKTGAKIGTTGRGIGPCYSDKALRIGKRVGDLEEEWIRPFVKPVAPLLHAALLRGEKILLEGAQGAMLDLTFGTYPYVTSSSTLASGVLAGAGLGPLCVKEVIGVIKAYTTRVGEGPFPTEDAAMDAVGAGEIGTTTGRIRRMGWFDPELVRYAVHLNSISKLALTKLDVLDGWEVVRIGEEELPGWKTRTRKCRKFRELPKEARNFVKRIEELVEAPIEIISVGPGREETIFP